MKSLKHAQENLNYLFHIHNDVVGGGADAGAVVVVEDGRDELQDDQLEYEE